MKIHSSHKKTLVLGASMNTDRYSNRAIIALAMHKIPTLAIGLREGNIGEVIIERKRHKYTDIHTITLYLNPKRQKDYYDYIISLQPKRVIFNPGTENSELMALLDENGIDYEIACTLTLLAIEQY